MHDKPVVGRSPFMSIDRTKTDRSRKRPMKQKTHPSTKALGPDGFMIVLHATRYSYVI